MAALPARPGHGGPGPDRLPALAAAARLLVAAVLAGAPAAPAAGDLAPARDAAAAESAAASALADSAARPPGPTPRGALLRSTALPGWGQVANGRPVKGALFGAATGGLAGYALAGQRHLNRVTRQLDRPGLSSAQRDSLNGLAEEAAGARNTRVLLLALSVTAAALDAYVDAHLADFGPEPALEVHLAPATGAGPTWQLACSWRF